MSTNSMEIPRHVTVRGPQNFIEDMVEEIVIEDRPFDLYKDELRKRCEDAGVDYSNLEYDLEDFLENLNMGIRSPDGLAVRPIHKRRQCFEWGGRYLELDTFLSPPLPHHLLEIEHVSMEDEISFPPFLKVIKEVTNDPEWYNSNIASNG